MAWQHVCSMGLCGALLSYVGRALSTSSGRTSWRVMEELLAQWWGKACECSMEMWEEEEGNRRGCRKGWWVDLHLLPLSCGLPVDSNHTFALGEAVATLL